MRRTQGMFGNVAACRHTLGPHHREWMAALCGTCLAVRDGSGQVSRALVTTDAVAAAVLAHEVGGVVADRRIAGPCPARGMLPASVWTGPAAAVGAAVSLLAAGIALDDKAADGDLPRVLRRPAGRWAASIVGDGVALAAPAGLDASLVIDAQARSRRVEASRSTDLAAWCAPVEDAFAAAFAPVGLDGVGAAVGRVTLLADAVADREDDERRGAPNPILAGACTHDAAVAMVDRDLRFVAATVAAAAPDSLSAALWGPAWRNGVETAMGLHRSCSVGERTRDALAGAAAIGVVGVAMAPTQWGGPGGPGDVPGPFGAGGQPTPGYGPGRPLPGYGAPPPGRWGKGLFRRKGSAGNGWNRSKSDDACDFCCCCCCCADGADCC